MSSSTTQACAPPGAAPSSLGEHSNATQEHAPNIAKPRRTGDSKRSERIESILEEARRRRTTTVTGAAPDTATHSAISSAMGGSHSTDSAPASPRAALLHGESSADEETSFVRSKKRDNAGSYQGTSMRAERQGQSPGSRNGDNSARRNANREGEENVNEEIADEQESWWQKIIAEYGSIELENKGSVARDHLALERTFLAWLRTSLAFASIGIAITQLFRLNTTTAANGGDPYKHLRQLGKPLGSTFLGISIVILFVGFHRYFEGQHWIIRGKFPASRGSIALVAAITLMLMITSLIVVVVVGPGSFEK